MYTITKSLHVCLDQILHFDVYKITLDHILSLESSSAEFLKTRAGIKNWLNRFETFDTFRFWTKRNARESNFNLIGPFKDHAIITPLL